MANSLSNKSYLMIENYGNKLNKILKAYHLSEVDTELPIDSKVIRKMEKIALLVSQMSVDDILAQKQIRNILRQLATNIIKVSKALMVWYAEHKSTVIKLEEDGAKEKTKDNKDESDSDLEKQYFTIVPLLSQLIR